MKFTIGIDGGGTKTEAICINPQGEEIGHFWGKQSNPFSLSAEHATLHITSLLDNIFSQPLFPVRDCNGICLGIAGVDRDQERKMLSDGIEHYFSQLRVKIPFCIKNDAEIALMAAFGEMNGIIAIAGTGSIVFGVTKSGERYRVGGWGHLLGDEGSGYQIGLHTLQAVAKSHDGIYPATRLTGLVLQHIGGDSPQDLKSYVYNKNIGKREIAGLAKLCIAACNHDDEVARQIIDEAASQLARLVLALRQKNANFQHSSIAVAGSIFGHSGRFRDTFCRIIAESGATNKIIPAAHPAAMGAARIALQLSGRNEA
ncbi:MAG TPA: BadF/BadG/BcrA/BcrD ATPase family protein [Bacilli bacterium]